jgi:hypothetical protein
MDVRSLVRVAGGLSLTGGLEDVDGLEGFLGKIVVSLRISVTRIEVTSDGMGW